LRAISSRWSPDGKQIVFTVRASGQRSTIYLVSAEGGDEERLVETSCGDADPTWSTDGNKLVYGLAPGLPCDSAIYLFDLKSRQISKVAGSEGLYSPRYSPDGNSILAVNPDGSRLMLFKFATQRWELIAEFAGSSGWARDGPEWSHDGKSIYFMNSTDVIRVSLSDLKIQNLVSLTGVAPLKYGTGLSLAPDDSPIVLRETVVPELYALSWVAP
jgi:Tol biopolymer transport system component